MRNRKNSHISESNKFHSYKLQNRLDNLRSRSLNSIKLEEKHLIQTYTQILNTEKNTSKNEK
jgi:hypothetical protein